MKAHRNSVVLPMRKRRVEKKRLRCNVCSHIWVPNQYPEEGTLYTVGFELVFNRECPYCHKCDCSPFVE